MSCPRRGGAAAGRWLETAARETLLNHITDFACSIKALNEMDVLSPVWSFRSVSLPFCPPQ